MYVMELFDPAVPGYQDPKADQSVIKMDQSRNNRITLAHLNQLRVSHDVRKLEHEQKLERVSKQYTPPADTNMMPGGL